MAQRWSCVQPAPTRTSRHRRPPASPGGRRTDSRRDAPVRSLRARRLGFHVRRVPRGQGRNDREPRQGARQRPRHRRSRAALGIFHEAEIQHALSALERLFSAYYMAGFAPLIATTLVWLGLRHPQHYRELRTALLISISVATVVFVVFPAAPPRLIPGLGIADTVGLSGHDSGSFAGIRFNPYAAMPSMHVGWSLLVGLVGYRAARRRFLRLFFAAHPAVMVLAVTATGNHFALDAIAGAAIASAVAALVHGRRRLRSRLSRSRLSSSTKAASRRHLHVPDDARHRRAGDDGRRTSDRRRLPLPFLPSLRSRPRFRAAELIATPGRGPCGSRPAAASRPRARPCAAGSRRASPRRTRPRG